MYLLVSMVTCCPHVMMNSNERKVVSRIFNVPLTQIDENCSEQNHACSISIRSIQFQQIFCLLKMY